MNSSSPHSTQKMNQLTKLPPAWHQDAAQSLKQSFDAIHIDFLNSTRKAVSLGLFLNAIKVRGKEDGSIPHGEFRPWCEKNVPDLNPYTLSTYMTIGRGVIEKAQLEIADFAAFASGSQKIGDLSFAHSGQLPSKVEDLISGKTQQQLLLAFKQTRLKNDCYDPTVGRQPGEGGREAEPDGDISAIIAFHRKYSIRHMGKIDHEYSKMGLRFLHCDDGHIAAFIASAERVVRIGNAWLNAPPAKRDPKAMEKLWNQL